MNGINTISTKHYILSAISFIPLIGIPFGIWAIIWGLVSKKEKSKRIALIGLLGILSFPVITFTAGFISGAANKTIELNTRVQEIKIKVAVNMSKESSTALIPLIEQYKIQHQEYPENLSLLGSAAFLLTPDSIMRHLRKTSKKMSEATDEEQSFYYERLEDGYYLLSKGFDNIPFTEDDVLPSTEEIGRTGYRIKQ